MARVTFLPMNQTFEARVGESVLDCALRNGIHILHSCGGFGACSACHVIVKAGQDNLSEPDDQEEERLERAAGLTLHSRLACRAKVHGDVTVQVMNLEPRK